MGGKVGLGSAFVSAFVNNVPVVVLLLPVLVSVSVRSKKPASSLLMPMGSATLLGGMCTTIGTSTNLLVVSVSSEMGLRRLGRFDFLLPAAITGALGILYLGVIAPRILPRRELPIANSSPRVFNAHLLVLEGSPAHGKTLSEVMKIAGEGVKVNTVLRGENTQVVALPDVLLRDGDRLAVQGTPEKLKEVERLLGATLYPGDSDGAPVDEDHPLKSPDQQIAEIVVVDGSSLEGSTLSSVRFADRHRLITLGLHRAGKPLRSVHDEVGDIPLRAGDVLLVRGPREQMASLKHGRDVLVLDATADLPFTRRAPIALLIMSGIVMTAAFGVLPIAVSASAGALSMILTGCMSWRDAARALSIQVILVVVASLALGSALLKTGGALFLGDLFLNAAGGASPRMILALLMLMMATLTNIVSNNAAAVIGNPIAVSMAEQLGLPPEPFVLAVLFGANMSFATPMAYKTNPLVMNAGGYTFLDFVRVGVPLILILWLTLSWVLPILYGVP
jgi:di/tricarboxylate transporter